MSDTFLSPVQYLNLVALTLLRECCDQDPIAACEIFGLTKSELDALRPHLSAERLLAVVANSGQESFLCMRPDTREILAGPPPLLGALSAVRNVQQPVGDRSSDCA